MNENTFYIIKDDFFKKFNDPYLKGNKTENRPHYFCFKDDAEGLFWVIPMSSRVEKYKRIMEQKAQQHKPCDIVHVCKIVNGKESVFLIQDMFPITNEYILRPYTINNVELKLVRENDIKIIHQKAKRILNLIERGKQFLPCQVDTMKIKKELLSELSKNT